MLWVLVCILHCAYGSPSRSPTSLPQGQNHCNIQLLGVKVLVNAVDTAALLAVRMAVGTFQIRGKFWVQVYDKCRAALHRKVTHTHIHTHTFAGGASEELKRQDTSVWGGPKPHIPLLPEDLHNSLKCSDDSAFALVHPPSPTSLQDSHPTNTTISRTHSAEDAPPLSLSSASLLHRGLSTAQSGSGLPPHARAYRATPAAASVWFSCVAGVVSTRSVDNPDVLKSIGTLGWRRLLF
eukprot:1044091-Pelagomonas_calceolata.AAC.7